MYKDVENFVSKCEICPKNKPLNQNTKNNAIITTQQNELWELDLIGRIPDRSEGNVLVFIAIDHHTKWIETEVIKTKDSTTILRMIHKLIIAKYGNPKAILCDSGL